MNKFAYQSADEETAFPDKTPPLASKITGVKLRRGQRVRLETPGGGGYGNAQERPEELIRNDLAQGYVFGKNHE
mgnify:FL=1